MMIHFYNPSAQRLRQEDSKSETALGNNQTLSQKTNPNLTTEPKTYDTRNIKVLVSFYSKKSKRK